MTRRILVALLALGLFSPALVRADAALDKALAVVPSDAMVFISVPNVKNTDRDFQQIVKGLGLDAFMPPSASSLIGLLQQKLPFFAEMDETGHITIIIMPATNLFEINMKQVVVLSARNPQAMIESMGGQAGDDGMWTVNIMGQPAYAKAGDGQVALGMMPDVVTAVTSSEKKIKESLKESDLSAMEGLDLVVWCDAKNLFTMIKPMMGGMFQMMAAGAGSNPFQAKQMEMSQKNLDMLFDGADTALFGLAMDDKGLLMRGTFRGKAGSELARQMKAAPTQETLLTGIPDGDYIIAAGTVSTREQQEATYQSVVPMFELLAEIEGVDQDKVGKAKSLFEEWVMMMSGARIVVESLKPGPGGLVGAAMLADTSDSKRWIELTGQTVELAKEIVANSENEQVDDDVKELVSMIQFTTDAETAHDAKVCHLKFDISEVEDLDEDEVESMQKIIGGEGLLLRMAAVNDKTVAITFGGGTMYLEQILAQAGKSGAPLDSEAGVKRVRPHLPTKRNAEVYIAMNHGLELFQNMMRTLEEDPLPIQTPKIDAPLAMTTTGGDGWSQFDVYFPAELMIAVKDVVMTMMGTTATADAGTP